MATQLLIYERAVPVSSTRHGEWSVEVGGDYHFSRGINSAPLMAVEFPSAASEYPIVFAGTAEAVTPAVILGLRAHENLFVDAKGNWQTGYVPAFLRRYPFVFSSSQDNTQFTLCIDEAFPGFNQAGRGARLFQGGKPTPYVDGVLKFLQEYQAQFQLTQSFCARLAELKLLDPMQAEVTLPAGAKTSLTGFMTVNRERLRQLPDDALPGLFKSSALELIYLHLQSLRNFERLKDRLAAQPPAPASPAP